MMKKNLTYDDYLKDPEQYANDLVSEKLEKTKKSSEFREGTLASLKYHLEICDKIKRPYARGTAQADAYQFGIGLGIDLWQEHYKRNYSEMIEH